MADRRVIPFHVEHYIEATREMALEIAPREAALLYRKTGPAWTAMVGDQVAACAGIIVLHHGLGEAWAVVTPLGLANVRFVHRAVRDGLQAIIQEHSLIRVQAKVIAGFFPGRLWAAHLGFREESRMPLAAPGGRDFIMCVQFPKGVRR
jgi:hypothetical protein